MPPTKRRSAPRLKLALVAGLWWVGALLVAGNMWVLANFGQLELEQFIYHLANLAEVAKPLGAGFITASLLIIFGIPTLVAAIATWFASHHKAPRHGEVSYRFQPLASGGWSRRKMVAGLEVAMASTLVPLLVVGVATPAFANNVGVFSFVENSKPSSFIEALYEYPESMATPGEPINLVVIYVESLENTYRDPALWGENLMDSLDKQTADWVTFPEFREVRGTGWTIAGLVASQCGVLLKEENSFDIAHQLGLKSPNRIGERVDSFMPGITCLGDVLQESGYTNVFMGGADLDFAGKGKFLTEHGYSRVLGQPYWESMGETEFTKWGLHDDDLLRHAKTELDRLHSAGQPFNMTVLTVDTHRPSGHLSSTCARKGAEDLPGIVACTSDMLADFVKHMDNKGYLDNTAVVITGDHLTMPNDVQDLIDQEENRTIYNRFYSPLGITANRDELMHFSIFPTILSMLGFDYPGNGLALGISGVKELEDNQISIYDVSDLDDKLRRPSDLYNVFWDIEPSGSS